MNVELYVLVENIALTNPQRNTLLAAVQQLGQGYMYPAPVRLDNQAGIFEARFRSGDILGFGWKTRLGTIFSINPLMTDIYESPASYGGGSSTEYVFSYLGIDYFRVILFGRLGNDAGMKERSAVECRGYLSANAAAWPSG